MDEGIIFGILETQQAHINALEAAQTELMTAITEQQAGLFSIGEQLINTLQFVGGFLFGAVIAIAVVLEMKKW
ncbi:MAG: hypothetical protein LBI19_02930 [Oscillospiraceae bacterium]|jgi:hypothetical protein|nr:hypothetical protein [Oscillospiraceae bacterium]